MDSEPTKVPLVQLTRETPVPAAIVVPWDLKGTGNPGAPVIMAKRRIRAARADARRQLFSSYIITGARPPRMPPKP